MTRISTYLNRIKKNIRELKREYPEFDDKHLLELVKMDIQLYKTTKRSDNKCQ